MNSKLKGVFIPIVTPFSGQKPDIGALSFNIERWNQSAAAGYMPLGSNGEFAHMDDSEQDAVLNTVMRLRAPNKVVMAGIARHSVYNTIERGKRAQDCGADFASVLTPSYFASFMDDAALINYYSEVASVLTIPVLMYNCPKFAANVTISEAIVIELSKHPNICGMKDTSSGNIERYLAVRDASFDIVAGSISNYYAGLCAGASGGVLSLANYLPNECSRIQDLYESGDVEGARSLAAKLAELSKRATDKYGVAGVKAGCDVFGYRGGEVRSPLMNLTIEQRESVRCALEEGVDML
jgi:4-hydroxy-2-oxoglutarate aldolase